MIIGEPTPDHSVHTYFDLCVYINFFLPFLLFNLCGLCKTVKTTFLWNRKYAENMPEDIIVLKFYLIT